VRSIVIALLAGCRFSGGTQLAADASGRDAPIVEADAFGTGTDAPTTTAICYGPAAGAFRVCLGTIPTGAVVLPATIDTTPGMPGSPCLEAQPLGWTMAQPPACFIAGSEISVPDITAVTGSRPLVLVADREITIPGTLDVASHVDGARGPGLAGAVCLPFAREVQSNVDGAGGGAGGSFTTPGGNGGDGDKGAGGLTAGADVSVPANLRAGCEAQTGGSGIELAGQAGAGGGALYLLAGGKVTVIGLVNASGAGGASGGKKSGGSGGGSGGMIALYAPMLDVRGTLMANGGGGAAGGGKGKRGNTGFDPDPTTPTEQAPGGVGDGAAGGAGYAAGRAAGDGADGGKDKGGGGGGGGAGYILTSQAIGGTVTPPSTVGL
jgi:hypothetical protein